MRTVRRIIGIDPGLASTGWGLVEYSLGRIRYLAHGCIETKADSPRGDRLFFIYRSIQEVLDTWEPGESAMETLYFGRNVSSAIPVAEARGVLSVALAERGLSILELSPGDIKRGVVGVTRADKRQIQEMVRLVLNLPVIPSPDHAADALGAAICAANTALTAVPPSPDSG
ncbi:MAG: crossover junction endodeoxyribonuclease RuvC [Treponema sp.]|jgi:crossover junction endodeoxyribonuclease RuvC|nr:crossover junction endodeoxyribonuclease RuvC [Treponema sp.]